MGNYGCIAVGINRYHFFQPLNYAQADAQALRQFLVDAGWQSDRCLLLTDTSLPVKIQEGSSEEINPTYPTRENIINIVKNLRHKPLKSGDLLWFFFSGYGVNWQGEDYLMPIDGNPAKIAETGISIKWLFDQLKVEDSQSVFVLLDINRSQGLYGDNPVGIQTVELAQKLGITTILSCQLDQFSHEAAALSHGLFTTGLLEALRYDRDITLTSLETYLRKRLPELSEHHWKPAQTPLCVASSPRSDRPLLHAASNSKVLATPVAAVGVNQSTSSNGYKDLPIRKLPQEGTKQTFPMEAVRIQPPITLPLTDNKPNLQEPAVVEPEKEPIPVAPVTNSNEQPTPDTVQIPFWQQLLFWSTGVLLVVGMIAGVYIRNQEAFTGKKQSSTAVNEVKTTTQSPAPSSSPTATTDETLPTSQQTVAPKTATPKSSKLPAQKLPQNLTTGTQTLQASQFSKAIAQAKKIPPSDPQYEEAQQLIANWSKEILNIAQLRAKQGDVASAIAAAQLVPAEQQNYPAAQQAIQEWQQLEKKQSENKILLQAAKNLVRPGNAVSYSHAIVVAKKVAFDRQKNSEAKQLIDKWSQSILSIAQNRANRGRFTEAIQTANLIPQDAAANEKAQKAIARWEAKRKAILLRR